MFLSEEERELSLLRARSKHAWQLKLSIYLNSVRKSQTNEDSLNDKKEIHV